VTVHRVALRVGAVMAAAVCLLAGLTTPAQAQQGPDVRIAGLGNVQLQVGGAAQSVTIRVENRSNDPLNGNANDVQLTMIVPLTEFGVQIASANGECSLSSNNTRMDCNLGDIPAGQSQQIVAQIAVPGNSPVQAGETESGNAQVSLSTGGQGSFNVRVQGPDRPPGVPEVSGVVTDENTGEGIEGANVFLTDGQQTQIDTTTDSDGNFRFTGDIAAGTIGLRATSDGYEANDDTFTAVAGEPLTGLQISLRSTASPTPSATPAATTAPPSTGTPVAAPASADSGGGTFTTIMIILGGLFVLLGIGAIVLLIIRRRREKNEDEGPEGADGPISGPRGPSPTPGSHGVYRPSPTQVMGPRGPLPAVGPQPALANAQTMMMQPAGETAVLPRAGDPPGPRPPVAGSPPPPRSAAPTYSSAAATRAYEEPPGRHANPAPGPGRYDEPTQIGRGHGGTYGNPPGSTYGSPAAGQPYGDPAGGQSYGSPAGGQSYGSPAGGQSYGSPAGGQSYGSPAGGQSYGSPAGGQSYGSPAGGQSYGSPAGGQSYGDSAGRHERGGYGSSQSYDGGGSYGPDPYTQPQPSYDQGGYNRGGYESGGGGYDRGGHDRAPGGYDRSAGYEARPGGHHGDGYGDAGQGAAPGGGSHRGGQTYGQPDYERPGHGQYGTPGHAQQPPQPPPTAEQPGYGSGYPDQSREPRPRHGEPTERRRLDWLDQ
jgi:carboxypeptidase family protein